MENKTRTEKECSLNKDEKIAERGTVINVAYGMIAFLSFTSNLVFCLAMMKRRRSLRTSHDLLIFSLAIADTLTGTNMSSVVFLPFTRAVKFKSKTRYHVSRINFGNTTGFSSL